MQRFAADDEQFVIDPVRNPVHPIRPTVENDQRKAQPNQQRALGDFEERNDFEITNTLPSL